MEPIFIILLLIVISLISGLLVVGYYIKNPTPVSIDKLSKVKLMQGDPIQLISPGDISLKAPSSLPNVNIVKPGPLQMSTIPNLNINAIPSLKVDPIPTLQIHADPLEINYGEVPIFDIAEIPPLRFESPPSISVVNTNACDGMPETRRDIGSACWNQIWKGIGCPMDYKYGESEKYQTLAQLKRNALYYVNPSASNAHKAACWGPNWRKYVLPQSLSVIDGFQHGWRWCHKCSLLNEPYTLNGICAAGGLHDASSSSYIVPIGNVPSDGGNPQDGWRWCLNCTCLVHLGQLGKGCAGTGGGAHNVSTSQSYYTYRDKPTDHMSQGAWAWCGKCGALGFSEWPAVCIMGGDHAWNGPYFVAYENNPIIGTLNCDQAKAEYIRLNPDVKASNLDAWDHYIRYGGRDQGRPWPGLKCPLNCTQAKYMYNRLNPDVVAAGMDPFDHYIKAGHKELSIKGPKIAWRADSGQCIPNCEQSKLLYLRKNSDVATHDSWKNDPWGHYVKWGSKEVETNPNRIWPGDGC